MGRTVQTVKVSQSELERQANIKRGELIQLFAEIKAWVKSRVPEQEGRPIHFYMEFFKGVDPELAKHEKDIQQWWTRPFATIMPEHEPVIKKLRAVIDHVAAA